ncbi:transcriptional regulator, AlpA family [Desulfatibacillum alkenivorans DSM 16219]|jgi:predicted DNA-binding transcriptional regulator AlpA|uniref:Transcriptional regulator, AlpA family n=1 Tax=Desulfatibacillum alkenivorans DSM 16219 TaxID=1121393 RepID=A0A1M6YKR5_9BACT|nr:helix-turn-helix domain-containing protein [Desulfatibacillum alkenivorans]SHL18856.1 transcriptional regulator, AlpA family [Desulfatibacillum alkenivorans DSM 16219]
MDQETIFMNEQEVSRLTGFALPTLRNWRSMGAPPAYHKIGRSVRYLRQDVLDFMESHRVHPRNTIEKGLGR